MKRFLSLLFCAACAGYAHGQNVTLKDGKMLAAQSVQRTGDTIMVKVVIPSPVQGQPDALAEVGYPVSQISRIDFSRPPELGAAEKLLSRGQSAQALAEIDLVSQYYENIGDIPGSWWGDVSLLKAKILMAMGSDKDAEAIAQKLIDKSGDPETVRAAKLEIALGIERGGDHAKALEIFNQVLKESARPDTQATAAVYAGQSYLAQKKWVPALLSFLQVPVFHPEQKAQMPGSLLGSGQAYVQLNDLAKAKESLDELVTAYGDSPEAGQGKLELEKIAKLEK